MRFKLEAPLYVMLLPGIALALAYQYLPMVGIVIAFQKFRASLVFFGSEWVGLHHFRQVFELPDFPQVLWNTVFIAVAKMVAGLAVPIAAALLLNEMRSALVKRSVQTMIYLPHFLSWVILGGILTDVLSAEGIVNRALGLFGVEPIFFLGSNDWFPFVVVVSDVWKEFGFGTIVYLAALTAINPVLYEAAVVDGAGKWRQAWHITLPGIRPIVVLMATLSLGNVLNAGFDQILVLYKPIVYESGDILDTYVYRMGLQQAQYSLATAIGLFKSVISFALISASYWLAYRYANYRIF